MTRRIDVQVHDVTARFALRHDLAPKTTEALWETLPIEANIRHGKLSGDACYFGVARTPLAALAEQSELPVTSIYKGWIVAFPSPARGTTEMLISYGVAEYRWPTGRRYVTPVAELEGDGDTLFDVLRRTQIEGEKRITIRRVQS
jgi:hypothetical protein